MHVCVSYWHSTVRGHQGGRTADRSTLPPKDVASPCFRLPLRSPISQRDSVMCSLYLELISHRDKCVCSAELGHAAMTAFRLQWLKNNKGLFVIHAGSPSQVSEGSLLMDLFRGLRMTERPTSQTLLIAKPEGRELGRVSSWPQCSGPREHVSLSFAVHCADLLLWPRQA